MPENTPKVIPAPRARRAFKSGFDQMAKLLAVTFGPGQGVVWSTTALKPTPEPITDAATIARRLTALPDREEDVGAMLMRSLAWRVFQRIGDGSATTAVLAQSILEHANRYVAAGANPVRVQSGIQKATRCAIDALLAMAFPAHSQEELAAIAFTATQEPEISAMLGEMFALLGANAHVVVENYMAPYLEREYIDGGLWQAKVISPHLLSGMSAGKALAWDANVVLYHGNVSSADDVLPIIKILSQKSQKNLLFVAHKISDQALNTLVATYAQNKDKLQVVAVDLVRAGEKARSDLLDLAVLTGAKLINPEAGDRLASIQACDMGIAGYAEADHEMLRVSGGRGDLDLLEEHIGGLRAAMGALPWDDKQIVEIKMRLGRLSGGQGILKIGAHTHNGREVLRQKAEQGISALQSARQSGVVHGGGTAFLHCIKAVEAMQCTDDDERLGYRVVAQALRKPFEQLLANAGIENSGLFAHQIVQAAPGRVFDLHQRKICTSDEAGILDAAQTLVVSLETASSGAQMALSTDVIILKRKPRLSYEPG